VLQLFRDKDTKTLTYYQRKPALNPKNNIYRLFKYPVYPFIAKYLDFHYFVTRYRLIGYLINNYRSAMRQARLTVALAYSLFLA